MSKILDISIAGVDPVLVRRASKVRFFDRKLKDLVDNMFATMEHNHGVGLAAPQVGLPYQLAVITGGLVIVNPKIVEESGERILEEGCLSVPGVMGSVPRCRKLVFDAQDVNGKHYRIKTQDDFLAHVCSHEIDHLSGVLYFHRMQHAVAERKRNASDN